MKKMLLSLILISISTTLYAQDATKGEALYKQCVACHGMKGEGNSAQKAPRLKGQYDWYLVTQLENMKAKKLRKNAVMDPFLAKLSAQDMKDLAAFISKL